MGKGGAAKADAGDSDNGARVPNYVVQGHGVKCGGLFVVKPPDGTTLTTIVGVRWFCCDGCPLYEIFLRLASLDHRS